MAGHSHAKNVMHRKAAQNKKKSKIFTKIAKMISTAAKEGTDPETNIKLRYALKQAQLHDLPKDVVKKALDKINEKDNSEEIIYEGYFQKIPILVETLTDNKAKTAPEIRAIFSKHKGSMSPPNTVMFLFAKQAVIICETEDFDLFFEKAIENDAFEIFENQAFFSVENFHKAQESLERHFKIISAEICYIPKNYTEPESQEQIDGLRKLLDAFEENDSVQNCWHNLTKI